MSQPMRGDTTPDPVFAARLPSLFSGTRSHPGRSNRAERAISSVSGLHYCECRSKIPTPDNEGTALHRLASPERGPPILLESRPRVEEIAGQEATVRSNTTSQRAAAASHRARCAGTEKPRNRYGNRDRRTRCQELPKCDLRQSWRKQPSRTCSVVRSPEA